MSLEWFQKHQPNEAQSGNGVMRRCERRDAVDSRLSPVMAQASDGATGVEAETGRRAFCPAFEYETLLRFAASVASDNNTLRIEALRAEESRRLRKVVVASAGVLSAIFLIGARLRVDDGLALLFESLSAVLYLVVIYAGINFD